jgi:tetratricopeptide (TPR) repeat protein
MSAITRGVERRPFLCGVFVCLVVVGILYSPVSTFSFLNFDDNEYVTENPWVRTGISWENIVSAFTGVKGAHWHPLTWISHMIDVSLFGLDSGSHHLMNVFIHAINVSIVFIFAYTICSNVWGALWIALFWGVHPLRLESVAWVSERKDVLCTFFSLVSLQGYLLLRKTGNRCWHLLTFLSFALALLAKPTAITLPALFVLLDCWPLRRLPSFEVKIFLRMFLEKIHFFLLALALVVFALYAQQEGGGLKSLSDYPLDARIPSVLVGYLVYLGKLIVPTGFGVFYPFTEYQPGVAAGAVCGLIAILGWFIKHRKESPYLLVGLCWFVVTLLPMIGIIQIGGQAYADRWSYLAHLGLILGVAVWWIDKATQYLPKGVILFFPALSLILPAAITVSALPYWKDSESIFRHTIEVSPDNFMAHMNLGVELDRRGALMEAMQHYEAAVMMRPYYPLALMNLAQAKVRSGQYGEAEQLFVRASLNPRYSISALSSLAALLEQQGLWFSAINEWVRVLKMVPNDSSANFRVQKIVGALWNPTCSKTARQFLTSREQSALSEIRQILSAGEVKLHETLRNALFTVINCNTASH